MIDYTTLSYGRNDEVREIFEMFEQDQDVSMPGPRRLGKTFVLDRLVDGASARNWNVVKIEVAGCSDARAVFRELCGRVDREKSGGARILSAIQQRLVQLIAPRRDHSGPWYNHLLTMDHETWFERLIEGLHKDGNQRWALLIDELPIFLKALHDRGPDGVIQARDFMNLTSRLRQAYPRVRWLITGSIGIEPLARDGNYLGVLAKYRPFELKPLTQLQAVDFVQNLAEQGRLRHRTRITSAEAQAIVEAVGWRAAFYLEALAQELMDAPSEDGDAVARSVEAAVQRLLEPVNLPIFGTWEEHLRKHYRDPERTLAFAALGALARHPGTLTLDTLLASIQRPELTRAQLLTLLTRLHVDGFLTVEDWDSAEPRCAFRNRLLHRWWNRYSPQPTA